MHITQSREIGDILTAVSNIPISKLRKICGRLVEEKAFTTEFDFENELTNFLSSFLDGKGNFMTAVKVAQLSLKHRMNKNAKPRVVIFCGHPLEEEQVEFERLGKRLR